MRNLSGIRNDVGEDRRATGVCPSGPVCPAAIEAMVDGDGRADGRREKFNHETFMRPGVLTIRRQIARRRRSEIIRNLQLTGSGRDADDAERQSGGGRGRQTSSWTD